MPACGIARAACKACVSLIRDWLDAVLPHDDDAALDCMATHPTTLARDQTCACMAQTRHFFLCQNRRGLDRVASVHLPYILDGQLMDDRLLETPPYRRQLFGTAGRFYNAQQ